MILVNYSVVSQHRKIHLGVLILKNMAHCRFKAVTKSFCSVQKAGVDVCRRAIARFSNNNGPSLHLSRKQMPVLTETRFHKDGTIVAQPGGRVGVTDGTLHKTSSRDEGPIRSQNYELRCMRRCPA